MKEIIKTIIKNKIEYKCSQVTAYEYPEFTLLVFEPEEEILMDYSAYKVYKTAGKIEEHEWSGDLMDDCEFLEQAQSKHDFII